MPPSRRQLLGWVSAAIANGQAAVASAELEAPLVVLQPLGAATPSAQIQAVSAALGAFYRVRLQVAEAVALPRAAFYAPRARYRAERLLEHLARLRPPAARVVLGLTAADISTSKGGFVDWGVLGLATLDGASAVLSSFRCRRGARGHEHVRERFAKTAVHELGHAFGLEHCPTPGCIMHDGEGSVLTTDTERDLCAETRQRLVAAGVLRPGATSPFDR